MCQKSTPVEEKYQTISFEKVSENGVLLYVLDIFRFQSSTHALKLDVP